MTSIGNYAFNGCYYLTSVTSEIKEPFAINSNVFSNYDIPLYVPKGTTTKYEATEGWNNFITIMETSSLYIADNDPYIRHQRSYPHIRDDENTWCNGFYDTWREKKHDVYHIYKTKELAVLSDYTHLLAWNGQVNLEDVLVVHGDNDGKTDASVDLQANGLSWRLELDDYNIMDYDPNALFNTSQENLFAWLDGNVLKACYMINGKRDITKQSRSSIGREPLLKVQLVDNGGIVVAEGYVKFKIGDIVSPAMIEVKCDIDVADEVTTDYAGNSIDGVQYEFNFYEIEEQILDKMKGVSKSEFENNCCFTQPASAEYDMTIGEMIWDSSSQYALQPFVNYGGKWVPCSLYDELTGQKNPSSADIFGNLYYSKYDHLNRSKDILRWDLTDEQLQRLQQYAEAKVALRLYDPNNSGYPEVFLVFTPKAVAESDIFTALTKENVLMTFKILDREAMTCQVGSGEEGKASISTATAGEVTIPETAKGYSVVAIGDYGFYNCSKLTRIWETDNIKSIGKLAFYGCNSLKVLDLPSVEEIEEDAFENAGGSEGVTIKVPADKVNIVPQVGGGNNNVHIAVTPPSDKTPEEVIDKLERIFITKNITSISERAFSYCKAVHTIVVETGNPVFDSRQNCNAIIRTADNTLMYGCQNTVVVAGVEAIDAYAFEGHSNLKQLLLPNTLTSIGKMAFFGCNGLKKITLPSCITSIGIMAFAECSGLTAVTASMEEPIAIDDNTFSMNTYENATLYVPSGTQEKYTAANGWKNFKNIAEIELVKPGDLTGDKEVNGTDLVILTNMILGQTELSAGADLNGDGDVNGTDFVLMVNMILGINQARQAEMGTVSTNVAETLLTIDPLTIRAGETKELAICMRNPGQDVTLAQMDLLLPEGLMASTTDAEMSNRTSWTTHTLAANELEDGTLRLLLASATNKNIEGTAGTIVRLTVTAGNDFAGGDIVLENALCVSPDATTTRPQAYVLHVDGTTGINDVTLNENEGKPAYNLSGQRISTLRKGVIIVNGRKIVK